MRRSASSDGNGGMRVEWAGEVQGGAATGVMAAAHGTDGRAQP